MTNPTAAMLVIGDEILSGRTRDSNTHHIACELTRHGIDLREVRVIADDAEAIAESVRALSAAHDHVFTSGGIGPTHDDITAESVADAFGVSISVRDDARAILEEHYRRSGIELNEARLRMARIPQGAELIENPVSGAPGFRLGNVHVLAGVPKIFEAMLACILRDLAGGTPMRSRTKTVHRGEGTIAAQLGAFAERHPDLSVGCYPFEKDGRFGASVVLRGPDADQLDAAMAELDGLFADR